MAEDSEPNDLFNLQSYMELTPRIGGKEHHYVKLKGKVHRPDYVFNSVFQLWISCVSQNVDFY